MVWERRVDPEELAWATVLTFFPGMLVFEIELLA
jgi:hypothetical protein